MVLMLGMQELVVKRNATPRERRTIDGGYLRASASSMMSRVATQADVVVAAEPKQKLGGIEVGPPTVRRALVLSFWDGAFATSMIALTETFGIAAAVSLKAPSMAIALLGSTPLLLGSLGQYFLPAFVDLRHARKAHVLVGVGLQSAFLLAAAFAGFVAPP